MSSSSIPYQQMHDETPERGGESSDGVATITSWATYQDFPPSITSRRYPQEYAMIIRQPSSTVQMQNCAITPGEAHLAQPHDIDYGSISHTGMLNLMAMSEIRLKTRTPMEITCPHCYMHVVTMLRPKRGLASYICFVLLILCGCILGCCLIPLYWTPFLDIRHVCPHCQKQIGVSYVL